jgi:hypothetical protein
MKETFLSFAPSGSPVNERARLDFEAGLELPDRAGFEPWMAFWARQRE